MTLESPVHLIRLSRRHRVVTARLITLQAHSEPLFSFTRGPGDPANWCYTEWVLELQPAQLTLIGVHQSSFLLFSCVTVNAGAKVTQGRRPR